MYRKIIEITPIKNIINIKVIHPNPFPFSNLFRFLMNLIEAL